MVARLTSIQFSPDKLEEVTRSIAPALTSVKASPGFKSALLLADRTTSKAAMVTVWESEAAMQESLPSARNNTLLASQTKKQMEADFQRLKDVLEALG